MYAYAYHIIHIDQKKGNNILMFSHHLIMILQYLFSVSGMTVTGIFVFTMYQYKYIPGSFSCDISIDAFSLTASLGTVVVPCFGCILLNVSTVWKVFTKKEVLPTGSTQQNTTPRQILISVTRSSESSEFKTHPNNQTTGDKDKSSSDATTATNGKHATKSLALLQISMSLVIIISFVIKVVSHRLFPVGDPFLKINLVLTGLSCFVQPTICFITMKPLRLYIKKLFRCQHFEDTYEQAPQLAPLPRSDGFQSTDIPSFLLPTDTKVPTIRVAKKVSDTSAIVLCRIQLGETRPRKNSRVVSSVEIEHKKSVHLQFHVGNESRRESMKNDNGEQSCSTDMDDSVVITTSSTVADKNDPIFVRNEKLCMKFRRQSLSTGNDVSSDKLALSRPSPTSLSEDGAAVSLYFTFPDPDCVRYKKYVTRDIPQAWVQELDQDANPLETQALDDGTEINNIFPTEEVEQY